MRLKLLLTSLVLLFLSAGITTMAQPKDEDGNYLIKEMSRQDFIRVFGEFGPQVMKVKGDSRYIKESIIQGNKIQTVLYNYGGISHPNAIPNVEDLVWEGLGYGFEFSPLAGSRVEAEVGDSINNYNIISDGHILTTQGDYDPTNTVKWGWLPKKGYVDTSEGQNEIARLNIGDEDGDGKPDSWPDRWYSEGAGEYVWPAFLGDQATAPDEEVYYVVDDYTNAEYPYYPFPSDSSKRGLGLDMEVRVLQFNNLLAQDIMFLVYNITNASEKVLDPIYFGMHGDPHVGGANDYSDDRSDFIDPFGVTANDHGTEFPQRTRNMVFSWDDDGVGDNQAVTGYFGWKFLESPSNANNAFDDDDDGIRDESPRNGAGRFIDGDDIPLNTGIYDVQTYTDVYGEPQPRWEGDEDGDWDPETDDVGIDGIGPESDVYPGPDEGEGDGEPSQLWYLDENDNGQVDAGETLVEQWQPGYTWSGSEPNFGVRDISESDQIGLKSFTVETYGNTTNVPKQDDLMWQWMSSDSIAADQKLLQNPGDNIFNFSTGPLELERGENQRFSMAILVGDDLNDLQLNAETSVRVLEADYQFAQPPDKPKVSAVPGDGKVTLYWDVESENSFDPLTGEQDFQGYKIYRSRDHKFSDVFTITDANGNPFLGKPIAQFDKDDSLSGFHPMPFQGRGVKYDMGDNTGLVHEYVDSTVTNGIRYFYAVVAYDSGTDILPPTETQAVIEKDPITGVYNYDVNTLSAMPRVKAQGVVDAQAGQDGKPEPFEGITSTGDISLKILDEMKVPDEKDFLIAFDSDSMYNVKDSSGVRETFTGKGEVFVSLGKTNIDTNSVEVYDAGGNLVSKDRYEIKRGDGSIKGTSADALPKNEQFEIFYRYYPVYRSQLLNYEDSNPAFYGMRIFVENEPLQLDTNEIGWINETNTTVSDTVWHSPPSVGGPANRVLERGDWEIKWNKLETEIEVDQNGDTTYTWANPGDIVKSDQHFDEATTVCPFTIVNTMTNEPANYIIKDTQDEYLGRWDFGEEIILQPQVDDPGFTTSYDVLFKLPEEEEGDTILPQDGDVYQVITQKPFLKGDKYYFQTASSKYQPEKNAPDLDEVYVVPNPYIAYSKSEEPGRTQDLRGEREVQFRNLPPKCTIRIYTITGELVKTLRKDDMTSQISWNLLTFEGQRTAYGVYIYHVDAPGVGEKIGRLALIK